MDDEPETCRTVRPANAAWTTTLNLLAALETQRFPVSLAALLHLFVDPRGAADVCRRWKLSSRDTDRTRWLVENHSALLGARGAHWPRLQRILVAEGIEDLLELHQAIAAATGNGADDVDYCRELLKMAPDELNPAPLVTGDDLIAHGVPRGKQYQALLEAVRDAQLERTVTTKRQALELVDRLRNAGQPGEAKPP